MTHLAWQNKGECSIVYGGSKSRIRVHNMERNEKEQDRIVMTFITNILNAHDSKRC